MQNSNCGFIPTILFFLTLLQFAQRAPAQTTYVFTKIANTNHFAFVTVRPSLNDTGMVAFQASSLGANGQRDGRSGIFAGRGGEVQLSDYLVIFTNRLAPYFQLFTLGSYVGSRVAFFGITNPQRATGGFFSSDGATLQTIVLDPTIHPIRRSISVAFSWGT